MSISSAILRTVPAFDGVAQDVIESLAAEARLETLADEDLLFAEGEDAILAYLLLDGSISMIKAHYMGDAEVLETRHAIAWVGELAAFDGLPHMLTAKANGDCSLVSLPAESLGIYARRDPFLAVSLLTIAIQALRQQRTPWISKAFPAKHDAVAMDGSLVRLLSATDHASVIHCSLPAHQISRASYNVGIHEIWFFTRGEGALWRHQQPIDDSRCLSQSDIVHVSRGATITIPPRVNFQFRSDSDEDLEFICHDAQVDRHHANVPVSKGQWPPTVPEANGASSPKS